MIKALAFNPNLCDGARGCELTCADTWFNVPDAKKSSIRIQSAHAGFQARFCIQCGACVSACPVNAIVQLKNGVVHVKRDACIGCMSCVAACPYDVMYFDTDLAVAFKCVACGQCVKICPTDALRIVEVETPTPDLWNGVAWANASGPDTKEA